MIKKIGRRNCRTRYPALPISKYQRNQFIYPKIYRQYVLTLPSKSAKGHSKIIALCLQKLITAVGFDELIFMGDKSIPWLYRNSDYKPAKEAVEYLVANKLSKTFNGGLIIDAKEISIFFKHLFWLVRTNTVLANVHGTDEGQHIILNVCQYGNIHFYTLDEEVDKMFNNQLPATGLRLLSTLNCYEPFNKHGQIAGRAVTIV